MKQSFSISISQARKGLKELVPGHGGERRGWDLNQEIGLSHSLCCLSPQVAPRLLSPERAAWRQALRPRGSRTCSTGLPRCSFNGRNRTQTCRMASAQMSRSLASAFCLHLQAEEVGRQGPEFTVIVWFPLTPNPRTDGQGNF